MKPIKDIKDLKGGWGLQMIKDIHRIELESGHMKGGWGFGGTLRDERVFQIGDILFWCSYDTIYKVEIMGKERTIEENPQWLYKIKLPENLQEDEIKTMEMRCNHLFTSLADAEKLALNQLDHLYNLQKKDIERYFNQWK